MCKARWSEREKALSHSLQWKGLSPVCLRLWRVSSSDRANRQPQSSHSQMYGFSPVCVRRWAFRCEDLVYVLPQPGCSQVCVGDLRCSTIITCCCCFCCGCGMDVEDDSL